MFVSLLYAGFKKEETCKGNVRPYDASEDGSHCEEAE